MTVVAARGDRPRRFAWQRSIGRRLALVLPLIARNTLAFAISVCALFPVEDREPKDGLPHNGHLSLVPNAIIAETRHVEIGRLARWTPARKWGETAVTTVLEPTCPGRVRKRPRPISIAHPRHVRPTDVLGRGRRRRLLGIGFPAGPPAVLIKRRSYSAPGGRDVIEKFDFNGPHY